jgi:hypothetical protein
MFGPHEDENMFKYFRIIDQFGRITSGKSVDVEVVELPGEYAPFTLYTPLKFPDPLIGMKVYGDISRTRYFYLKYVILESN